MAEFFGFEIKRKKEQKEVPSVVSPTVDDGSTVLTDVSAYYGATLDLDASIKSENELIKKYRETALYPDCDSAVEDIVNEAIVVEDDAPSIDIVLDSVGLPNGIKNKVREEFEEIYSLFKFDERGHDIFRTWYVDGRLYYHVLIDPTSPKKGIQEVRYIDPRKIRKVKKVEKEKTAQGVEVVKAVEEFYMYNDKGITDSATQGVKLSLDSVVFTPSGNLDATSGTILSYLHKAIKPVNQLKMVEDAVVIYRLSRAPERRIFYVDVGNLPKIKAEQYVNDIMNKFRNKIVYDANTGEIKDDRKHLSMMEDFWMPRREGGKGTEITTLPGGQNLGDIADIQYFQKKLYQSLNVPMTRLVPEAGFNLGRSSEITRDELKFSKFIDRIRRKFSKLFLDTLRIQLVSKGVMSIEDWEEIESDIRFDFLKDNHFAEMKDNEILMGRVQMLQQLEGYIGKYYSIDWVRKNVLRQTEDEIKEIDKEIEAEQEDIEDLQSAQTAETDEAQQEADREQQNGVEDEQ